jgi:hypothetical protein
MELMNNFFNKSTKIVSTLRKNISQNADVINATATVEENVSSVSISTRKTISKKLKEKRKNTIKSLECRIQILEKELIHLKKNIEEDKEEINTKIKSFTGCNKQNTFENLKNEIINIIKNDSDIKEEFLKIIKKRNSSKRTIPKFPVSKITFKEWYSSFSNEELNSASFFENNLEESIKLLFFKNTKKNNEENTINPFYVLKHKMYIYEETGWKIIDIEDGKKFISRMISLFLTNFIKWRIKNQEKIENDENLAILETRYIKNITNEFKNTEKIFYIIKKWIIGKFTCNEKKI